MILGFTVFDIRFTIVALSSQNALVNPVRLPLREPLGLIPHEVAAKTAQEIEDYPEQDIRHLAELKAILDEEGSNYAR